MNTPFPGTDTIRTVLTLAARAPSIYNSQPWRWQVTDDAVHLYVDPDLQLPSTDPDGRDLMLSCGAALNHCVIALAAMGWRATVERFPDPDNPDHLATIRTCCRDVEQVDVMLAAAIPRRRTDRRIYSAWPVAAGDIALMAARAARSGVMLRRIDTVDRLNQIVAQAVWRHVTDYEYLAELTAWSGRYGSVKGVPARNTPAPDPTAAIPGRLFAGPALAQPPGVSPADDNAVILALGTQTDDRLARLRAGEATSVVLLTATAMGLASCPITEPLEITETRAVLRSDVFGASGFPQMLLRVGWAPVNADPLPPTPRRAVDDTVEWAGTGHPVLLAH
ncbi:putative NAD(P)H nitroreductase [Mycobacterium sp. MFM001]|uniref:Acg family FMN-binding oxidoreductase n=1 Tax=Mycobacterium sp. MFM001 TaxID=2049453 RepID=UPI000DA58013|nr:NAD(P)H nitroreductase [Mycobacterium sp. MFM001]GBE64342.1 putative NAD(P)H nitroreductase [Mycobacterium sp. MFM001]